MNNKAKLSLICVSTLLVLSIGSVAVLAGGPTPRSIIDTIFVPKDTDSSDPADSSASASDHGCDDNWSIWYSAPSTLPTGVWSSNWVNQVAINQHGGQDGYFVCNQYGCTTYLCSTDAIGAKPLSLKVEW